MGDKINRINFFSYFDVLFLKKSVGRNFWPIQLNTLLIIFSSIKPKPRTRQTVFTLPTFIQRCLDFFAVTPRPRGTLSNTLLFKTALKRLRNWSSLYFSRVAVSKKDFNRNVVYGARDQIIQIISGANQETEVNGYLNARANSRQHCGKTSRQMPTSCTG